MNTTSRPNPKVGDSLFLLNVGNNARYVPQVLSPATVTKVGRKYFTVKRTEYSIEIEFHLGSWRQRTDYSTNYELHKDAAEWEAEKEGVRLRKECRDYFGHMNNISLSNDQLQRILAITKEA